MSQRPRTVRIDTIGVGGQGWGDRGTVPRLRPQLTYFQKQKRMCNGPYHPTIEKIRKESVSFSFAYTFLDGPK